MVCEPTSADIRPYKAEVTAIGGRTSFVQSSDRSLRLELGSRPGTGGEPSVGTSPEQLLAAAYASCFLAAIRHAGIEAGVAIPLDANVTARIDVDAAAEPSTDGSCGGSGLGITLTVDLPGIDPAQRQALVDRAHATSRCSRAMRGSLTVRTVVD
jgi:osmotically inducible protein OsmC